MDIRTAREILGLEEKQITLESLRKAYRSLSKKYHPDATGNKDDHLFKLVGSSYELLLNNLSEVNSDKIETITSAELKKKLDRLVVDIIEMLTDDIYRKTVIPLTEEWFSCNAPLTQLNEAIKHQVLQMKAGLIYKIELKFDKFSKNLDTQLDNAFSGTADSIDTKALSDSLSESLTNILGVMTASIVAMISGGAGTALIASGPAGLIVGAGLGAYIFSKGRKGIKDGLNEIVMNNNLPVPIKGFVRDKVMRELRVGEADFKRKIKTQLKKDLDPIYKQIKLLNKPSNVSTKTNSLDIIKEDPISETVDVQYIEFPHLEHFPFGTFVRWSVNQGDYVRAGDILCSVANDKERIDITSTASGYIYEKIASDGVRVSKGRILCIISSSYPNIEKNL